jgi:hypothetical protein
LLSALLAGCGYSYRPIVDTIPKPGGDPEPVRMALVVNSGSPGTTTQINVSGDSNVGNFTVGAGPVHANFLLEVISELVSNVV